MKEIEAAIQEIQVDPADEAGPEVTQANSDPFCVMAVLPDRPLLQFEAHEGEVNAIKWLPVNEGLGIVATGGADRKVKIWEVTHSQAHLRTTLSGSNAAITSIDLESDYVLASSNDFASRVWSTDGKLRRTLTGHSNKVLAVKFLGVPNKVVSGSHDRTLKIWDLNRHACIRTLFAGSSCNDLVTRVGQESAIISGHFDKRIRFWDTRSDASANEIVLEGRITSLSVSPNNQFLLSCVRDDTLKQLDLRMNQVVRTYCAEGFKVGSDWTRAVFSPDNEYVAAGSSDGCIYIWNMSNGKVERILKDHHSSTVYTCAWRREREERNVLDELLDSHQEVDDLNSELHHSDKKPNSNKSHSLISPNKKTGQDGGPVDDDKRKDSERKASGSKGNEACSKTKSAKSNEKQLRKVVSYRSASSASSSGSCSCEDHSSVASDSPPKSAISRSPSPALQPRRREERRPEKVPESGRRDLRSVGHHHRHYEHRDPSRHHLHHRGNLRSDNLVSKSTPRVTKQRDYSSLIRHFFRHSSFFLLKSNNHENITLAKSRGVWSTPPQNEQKLNRAFKECRSVILVFSVKESGRFQGFARLRAESDHDHAPVPWILPPGLSHRALGGVFRIDWICRQEVPFVKTTHLFNAWNEGKPIKIGRDGQEIEPRAAEELCRLFPPDNGVDLVSIVKGMKAMSRSRVQMSPEREYVEPRMSAYDRLGPVQNQWHDEPRRPPPRDKMYSMNPPYAGHGVVQSRKRKTSEPNDEMYKRQKRDLRYDDHRYRDSHNNNNFQQGYQSRRNGHKWPSDHGQRNYR
ncbi:Autophagy-related protein 16-1 [Halotydeus destructor]|nr:Autophagy-related protein 16-1 [Halotydeus destructor]